MTHSAATHNWNALTSFKHLGEAIAAENDSSLSYGSEFKKGTSLSPIFGRHPLWPRLYNILAQGISFPLQDLSYEQRRRDTIEGLQFGNHKGATKHEKLFLKLFTKDIIHGYSLVIPTDKILDIHGALLAPLNIVEQSTIDETGAVVPAQRLTHNQSKVFHASNTSVNGTVIKEALQDCMYGHCIIRCLHYIAALRLKHPSTRILVQKVDYKSAYRRAHLTWQTAIQTITQVTDNLSQIALRATFGGAPNPHAKSSSLHINTWYLLTVSLMTKPPSNKHYP